MTCVGSFEYLFVLILLQFGCVWRGLYRIVCGLAIQFLLARAVSVLLRLSSPNSVLAI